VAKGMSMEGFGEDGHTIAPPPGAASDPMTVGTPRTWEILSVASGLVFATSILMLGGVLDLGGFTLAIGVGFLYGGFVAFIVSQLVLSRLRIRGRGGGPSPP